MSFTEASDTTGQHSDRASFSIRLTDEQGDPISNASVALTFTGPDDERSKSVETDANGIATGTFELSDPAGSALVTAHYTGRDKVFRPSSNSMFFEVVREVTELSATLTGKGSKKALEATLVDDDDTAVSGKTLVIRVDGDRICSNIAPTNASGFATCDVPARYQGGRHTFEVVFPQDDYFTRSVATTAS